ncbi:MAG: Maf family nucleotide pyrophosphatase [Gammaproteobacteria bacterium]|nr:Maf family nucleotide pyrophosphatase [Gammaproteobacteria bacterium]
MAAATELILASSSVHRVALMERLRLPFRSQPANIDESIMGDETPAALVKRLALAKALKVAGSYPDALVIGADEVAAVNGQILNKPEDHAGAVRQLRMMSGQVVDFLTGVCLVNSRTGHRQLDMTTVEVHFRVLTDAGIHRYLDWDKPYDCAGSFKSETAGITLVDRISSDDNTALLGLPLISLQRMLRNEGYIIP